MGKWHNKKEETQYDFLETKQYDATDYHSSSNDDDINKDTDGNEYSKLKNAKKRKHKQIAERKFTQFELDETELFFSYIAKILTKLPRYEQARKYDRYLVTMNCVVFEKIHFKAEIFTNAKY
ncbi:jg27496 [Pararge aegeria aegeria]|uniref:Jg27496 protein n=1 Tax=Pararge aegeria aegeria TaxID=348720 RepID=A0A8S4QTI9_9NEOP|nr:jg27496 [Pararge aegeria aegeria]